MSMYFFFNDTATTEIYTLSLHDALPIYSSRDATSSRAAGSGGDRRLIFVVSGHADPTSARRPPDRAGAVRRRHGDRSEEHTSELQSRQYLVCRLLLEKKKQQLYHSSVFH